jgi:hypothetical protein
LNVWTVFFLVVSAVILASPLLSPAPAVKKEGETAIDRAGLSHWEEDELELDLASGRLDREDFEEMTGRDTGDLAWVPEKEVVG